MNNHKIIYFILLLVFTFGCSSEKKYEVLFDRLSKVGDKYILTHEGTYSNSSSLTKNDKEVQSQKRTYEVAFQGEIEVLKIDELGREVMLKIKVIRFIKTEDGRGTVLMQKGQVLKAEATDRWSVDKPRKQFVIDNKMIKEVDFLGVLNSVFKMDKGYFPDQEIFAPKTETVSIGSKWRGDDKLLRNYLSKTTGMSDNPALKVDCNVIVLALEEMNGIPCLKIEKHINVTELDSNKNNYEMIFKDISFYPINLKMRILKSTNKMTSQFTILMDSKKKDEIFRSNSSKEYYEEILQETISDGN